MARDVPIGAEALAVLVVPLQSTRVEQDYLRWHPWDGAYGEPCGLDSDRRYAHEESPFKRYPGSEWPYFSPHVERLLFPREAGSGERWICAPEDLYLGASWKRDDPKHWARIDLLECLSVPDDEDFAFGLLHLSLEPSEDPPEPDHPLWWTWAIQSCFRRSPFQCPHFELWHDETGTELKGKRPIRELVERTLGTPRSDLERRLFTAIMVPCPLGRTDAESQAEWRLAMANGRSKVMPDGDAPLDPGEEMEQTAAAGKGPALVLGDCTVLTQVGPLTREDARNFRSYWSESLLVGLLQQESLERFQDRLAKLGSPVKPDIEPLYHAWLDFRNRVWWSQLATSSSIPQELLFRLRNVRGTDRLFTDLEGDLATYSAQRRIVVEDQQAAALVNLQVAGAAVVVLGPLLGIIALTGARGLSLAILVVTAVIFSILVAAGVWEYVRPTVKSQQETTDA